MEKVSKQQIYENQLYDFIPRLSAFRFDAKKGTEASVYFVDKKFVIKAYNERKMELTFFDKYCKEIRKFSYMGLNVPKIFAWAAMPIVDRNKNYSYIFYIMEENVRGSELYNSGLSDFYPKCSGFCSKREFNEALFDHINQTELYEKILKTYLGSFIEANQKLATLSSKKVDEFVGTLHTMKKKSVYSAPDFLSRNILFNTERGKEKLTLIDNTMLGGELKAEYKKHYKIHALQNILELFEESLDVRDYVEAYLKNTSTENNDLTDLVVQNNDLTKANALKWIYSLLNNSGRLLASEEEYEGLKKSAGIVLGEVETRKLCKEIEKEF